MKDFPSALYQVCRVSVPVAFELIKKTEWVFNEKKGRWQTKSPETKNDLYRRRMLCACAKNRTELSYFLNDVRYASSPGTRSPRSPRHGILHRA